MKAPILISTLSFLLVFILGSCGSESGGIKATGGAYEIVVVTDQSIWNDLVGDQLKDELAGPISGLPQPESAMRIMYVPTPQFKGILTLVRNILIVAIDETKYARASMKVDMDLWSAGQVVVYLTAPNHYVMIDYLDRNQGRIVNLFTRIEMRRMAEIMQKTYSYTVMEKVKSQFGIMLNVPQDMKAFRDTTDFFWTSNDATKGRMDMVVYSFPYTDPQTFTREYMLAMRDSILGAHIPGSLPNSYMSTNQEFTVYSPITLYGKYCGVLRGLWETKGDMMGGPFVSYARLDEANNRIIVAEGFVYAPESDKRNFMRRLEASLHTLRLPGEFEMSLDGLAAVNE